MRQIHRSYNSPNKKPPTCAQCHVRKSLKGNRLCSTCIMQANNPARSHPKTA